MWVKHKSLFLTRCGECCSCSGTCLVDFSSHVYVGTTSRDKSVFLGKQDSSRYVRHSKRRSYKEKSVCLRFGQFNDIPISWNMKTTDRWMTLIVATVRCSTGQPWVLAFMWTTVVSQKINPLMATELLDLPLGLCQVAPRWKPVSSFAIIIWSNDIIIQDFSHTPPLTASYVTKAELDCSLRPKGQT